MVRHVSKSSLIDQYAYRLQVDMYILYTWAHSEPMTRNLCLVPPQGPDRDIYPLDVIQYLQTLPADSMHHVRCSTGHSKVLCCRTVRAQACMAWTSPAFPCPIKVRVFPPKISPSSLQHQHFNPVHSRPSTCPGKASDSSGPRRRTLCRTPFRTLASHFR